MRFLLTNALHGSISAGIFGADIVVSNDKITPIKHKILSKFVFNTYLGSIWY